MSVSSGNESWQAVAIVGFVMLPYALTGFLGTRKKNKFEAKKHARERDGIDSSTHLARQRSYLLRVVRWPFSTLCLCMALVGTIFGWFF